MDDDELDRAEGQLASLLHKCEAVLQGSTLSPYRHTLMTNRVAALRTALALVAAERARDSWASLFPIASHSDERGPDSAMHNT